MCSGKSTLANSFFKNEDYKVAVHNGIKVHYMSNDKYISLGKGNPEKRWNPFWDYYLANGIVRLDIYENALDFLVNNITDDQILVIDNPPTLRSKKWKAFKEMLLDNATHIFTFENVLTLEESMKLSEKHRSHKPKFLEVGTQTKMYKNNIEYRNTLQSNYSDILYTNEKRNDYFNEFEIIDCLQEFSKN